MMSAFEQGLVETGHVVNRNVIVEYQWAEGQPDQLPMLAADLVRRKVALIVVSRRSGYSRVASSH
jgi:putative tryptophan/tyrosine transport system substrate-binding protein